jgi:hypothetical protein
MPETVNDVVAVCAFTVTAATADMMMDAIIFFITCVLV